MTEGFERLMVEGISTQEKAKVLIKQASSATCVY